jgi:hypothetical protein
MFLAAAVASALEDILYAPVGGAGLGRGKLGGAFVGGDRMRLDKWVVVCSSGLQAGRLELNVLGVLSHGVSRVGYFRVRT